MDYGKTLNLPKTEFPMRGNLPQKEPDILKQWYETDIYKKRLERNEGREKFILHDGPPYANGHLHLGTILNKILKDIVVKYKNMTGAQCAFIPGWDCHGLPIELGVEKKLGPKKHTMDPVDVRKACRAHAEEFVAHVGRHRGRLRRRPAAGAYRLRPGQSCRSAGG